MKKLIQTATTVTLALSLSVAWAQTMKLYQQPRSNAKVVATVASENKLSPIFFPLNSDWVKVADTSNGHVGWVKIATLRKAQQATAKKAAEEAAAEQAKMRQGRYSFQRKIIRRNGKDGKPEVIEVTQYGTPKKLSDKEAKKAIAEMDQEQASMQRHMDKMMRRMRDDFDVFYEDPFFRSRLGSVAYAPVSAADKHQPSWWHAFKEKLSNEIPSK